MSLGCLKGPRDLLLKEHISTIHRGRFWNDHHHPHVTETYRICSKPHAEEKVDLEFTLGRGSQQPWPFLLSVVLPYIPGSWLPLPPASLNSSLALLGSMISRSRALILHPETHGLSEWCHLLSTLGECREHWSQRGDLDVPGDLGRH